MEKECKTHGLIKFNSIGQGKNKRFRCSKCNIERVTKRRKEVKKRLVDALGGECYICGYKDYVGALAFHHLDPKEKEFGISSKGNTRSFERQLKELEKCKLVCLNCHAEIHHNI
jgi:hypothetical protein